MSKVELQSDPRVAKVFENYPQLIRPKMHALRTLVLEAAAEVQENIKLEETLKWGEPSYITKHGSTIRMDWKAKQPEQYALYFKCTSRLVETFKAMFNDTFTYAGNRAIVFKLNERVPKEELKACIVAALTYHKVKQLPDLGIGKGLV